MTETDAPTLRPTPVFVIGADRSGTTFVADLLGRSRQVLAMPEAPFLVDVLTARDAEEQARRAASALLQPRFRLWAMPPDDELRRAVHDRPGAAHLWDAFAAAWARHTSSEQTFSAWVDHTPTNVAQTHVLGRHHASARFVHMVRDGRAVAASVRRVPWGPNDVEVAAAWWVERICHGLVAEHELGPGRVRRVRFEDVLDDPSEAGDRLLSFIGVTGAPIDLERRGFVVPPYWARTHPYVGGPLRPQRRDAWREELGRRDIERFEAVAGDVLLALGYELEFGGHARRAGRGEQLRRELLEVPRRTLVNPVRHQVAMRHALLGSHHDASGGRPVRVLRSLAVDAARRRRGVEWGRAFRRRRRRQ